MTVIVDLKHERYVLANGSHLSFDECQSRIELYGIELVGRGKLPRSFLDQAVEVERGSIEAYNALCSLADELIEVAYEDGEKPVTMMTLSEEIANEVAQLADKDLPKEIVFAKESLDVDDARTVYWLAALLARASAL